MSEFTLYMMLIFLPGIIAYKIFDELTEHKEHKVHEVIIYAFLFGCVCYLVYFVFIKILFVLTGYSITFYMLDVLKDPSKASYSEIFTASCFAVFVGFGVTAIDTYKVLHYIARYLHVSRKHGELDTFTFLINSQDLKQNTWIIFRDVEDDRAYYGWVETCSAGHEKNEIFLRNVIVFENSTGEQLMTSPGIYLAKPKDKYVIEFPQLESSAKIKVNEENKDHEHSSEQR